MRLGIGSRLRRCKAVVDGELALVWNHVGSDAAADHHRVQAFAVDQAVNFDLVWGVSGEFREHLARLVNGVSAHPRSGAVRLYPASGHGCAHGAVASTFDLSRTRFTEHGELGVQKSGTVAADSTEAVERSIHFFMVIENPGDIDVWLADGCGEFELHGDAGLHVDGAATPKHLLTLEL